MATYVKYNQFVEDLAKAVHNFGTHTFKVALSNGTPAATHATLSAITELTTANGYTAGGATTTISGTTQSGGTIDHRCLRSRRLDRLRRRHHLPLCRALQRHPNLARRPLGGLLG